MKSEKIKNLLTIAKWHILKGDIHYSQCGEDMIVREYFINVFGKKIINYVDIGANHPTRLSNTYLFYKMGGNGILVEPNSDLCRKLIKCRKRDKVLNCGAGYDTTIHEGKYYKFNAHVLNTFSETEALELKEKGYKFRGVETIEIKDINNILTELGSQIDLLSIDTEGLDFLLLKRIDFNVFAPEVIILESSELSGERRDDYKELNAFLLDKGYVIFFETTVNTIYVRKTKYKEYLERTNTSRIFY